MNIPKAIEILAQEEEILDGCEESDFVDALKLGIESLKRLEKDRAERWRRALPLLPGETED